MTEFDLQPRDCVAGMADLEAESIDLVVTSPPYNLGIRYGKFSDDAERSSYLEWCEAWALQIHRLLRPNGSLFLNLGAAPSNPLLPHELALRFSQFFVLQNTIHWIKAITLPNEAGDGEVSRGHFKPINSPRFLNDCHEYIFHFTPNGKTPLDRLALGVRLPGQEQHRPLVTHGRARFALPGKYLVHSL